MVLEFTMNESDFKYIEDVRANFVLEIKLDLDFLNIRTEIIDFKVLNYQLKPNEEHILNCSWNDFFESNRRCVLEYVNLKVFKEK